MALLAALALAGSARANTSITLTPGTTSFQGPIGITYSEPLKQLLLSVNYPDDGPALASLAPDGTYTPFSTLSGIGGSTANSKELYPVAIRTSGCEGGFKPGDVYFEDNNTPGVIGKITVDPNTGQPVSVTDPWVTLPLPAATKAGTYVAGLVQDSSCSFGGDLIATTYNDTDPGGNANNGAVWRVTSGGAVTAVASNVGAFMEGPTTVPPDVARYGPWAGTILVSDEAGECIYSVAANGSVSKYRPPAWQPYGNEGPEGVLIVPANENLFAVDYGGQAIDQAPASQLTGVVGDVVVFTEVKGGLWDVRWNAATSSFDTYDMLAPPGSGDTGQFEGVAFTPAGLLGVKTAKTADAASASPGSQDGYTITVSNQDSNVDVGLDDITDTLPAGFTYVAGSSSGVTTAEPSISGQKLTWNGPFDAPMNGSVSLHFEVMVSSTAGTYYNNAGADSSAQAVTPTGPTAPITVGENVQPLTTAKTADTASVAVGSADGYTIKVSNPNAQAEPLSSVTDTLPAGFSYTKGSSSGLTTADPMVSGQTLTWGGSFTVPAQSSISLHFKVTVSNSTGTFYNTADGSSATVAVTGTGPTAPVTVVTGFGLPGTDGGVTSAAVSKGTIYLGGLFGSVAGGVPGYHNIAEYAAGGWTALGAGLNGRANAILVVGGTVYAGGSFTATSDGATPLAHLAKWNGHSWSQVGGGVGGTVNSLAYHNGVLYVGGAFTSVGGSTTVGDVAAYNLSAKNWSTLAGGVNGPVYAAAWNAVLGQLFVTGSFGHAGSGSAGSFASWDGSSWNAWNGGLTASFTPSGDALAVDPSSGAVYVGGAFQKAGGVTAGNLAELSAGAWSDAGDFTNANGTEATIHAVSVSGGRLYAEGQFDTVNGTEAARLAVNTGGTWAQVGQGINDGTYGAMAPYGGGVVIGGNFTNASPSIGTGLALNRVGIWSGSGWATLGQGVLTGGTNTIAGHINALLSSGSGAYAGGAFSQVGSVQTHGIARWTGARWVALAGGLGGSSGSPIVRALVLLSGKLYVAGTFTTAGGVAASNIAMWDGSAWHALGGGLNGNVYALTVIGGNLYAGGDFGSADGQSAGGVAEYVPPSSTSAGGWKPVGGNPSLGAVRSLATLGNRYLLIGGNFGQVGSNPFADGFAEYDTTTTSFPTDISGYTFPGGVTTTTSFGKITGTVSAIRVMPGRNGDVFLGGSFDHADVTQTSSGTAAGNLADWQAHPGGTGSPTWAIPTGVSGGSINALAETTKTTSGAATTPTLYATGTFTQAGTQAAAGLARYSPSTDTWNPLGTGLGLAGNYNGGALAQNGTAGLYIGGSFLTADGRPSDGVALWAGTHGLSP